MTMTRRKFLSWAEPAMDLALSFKAEYPLHFEVESEAYLLEIYVYECEPCYCSKTRRARWKSGRMLEGITYESSQLLPTNAAAWALEWLQEKCPRRDRTLLTPSEVDGLLIRVSEIVQVDYRVDGMTPEDYYA